MRFRCAIPVGDSGSAPPRRRCACAAPPVGRIVPSRAPAWAARHRVTNALARMGGVDVRLQHAVGHERRQLPVQCALRLAEPARQPEATQRDDVNARGGRHQATRRATRHAVGDHGAARTQTLRESVGGRAAHRNDPQVDGRSAGRLAHAGCDVVAIGEGDVACERLICGRRRYPPERAHRPDAVMPRELHQVAPHSRVGRVPDHPVARGMRNELAEEQCRGGWIDGEHGQLQRVGAAGERDERPRLGQQVRDQGAAAERQQDEPPHRRSRDVRAQRGHSPDAFVSANRRQRGDDAAATREREHVRQVDG